MSNEKNGIPEAFLSPYDPTSTEDRIYAMWEQSGYFNPDICLQNGVCAPDAEHFSIVLPPPNVTGQLHVGHAAMLAIEDIMVRFYRMNGKKTLWIPGTDHAAIATQSRVEKDLSKKKIRKSDMSREEFLQLVTEFAQEKHDTIVNQVRKMGASVDWSREAFTLDETRERAVFTAFKKMFDDGLIYRKDRIVNWDVKGQTTISDDEVVHEERTGKLYTFKYSKDFPIPIASTRPETKLGDTGVAVHPDGKWKEYIGQEFSFNFAGADVTVRIVGDDAVDPEFGTGAVGVTPAHSQTDWEIGERHNLTTVQVINEFGKMMVGMEGVKDQKTTTAREKIVEWLTEENLLENVEDIAQNISTAERTGGIIEPLPKLQWWIDVNKPARDGKSLKELMLESVKSGDVTILPERFERVYYNWIENLRDWNISRQIWYGHRIPVWYKGDDIQVSLESPGDGWEQDPDTLDTWFSSGLWTFSTLGWPEQTEDLQNYHPTSVLETGYDILFFWVARMILMSQYLLGQKPFETVYLHGLVRDEKGQKISKSLGNNVDPLDIIEKYGTDALRMALIIGTAPGQDAKIGDDKIKAYKKFANKLWNITRFVSEQVAEHGVGDITTDQDREYIESIESLIAEITPEMDEYKYYLVGEKLYHYIWHTFADEIIEEVKSRTDNKVSGVTACLALLTTSLKLLHPFMPFITEEIWQLMGHEKMLMIESWPNGKVV